MTSSELYHGFGLECYRMRVSHIKKGTMILEIVSMRPPRYLKYNRCDAVYRGQVIRDFSGFYISSDRDHLYAYQTELGVVHVHTCTR